MIGIDGILWLVVLGAYFVFAALVVVLAARVIFGPWSHGLRFRRRRDSVNRFDSGG